MRDDATLNTIVQTLIILVVAVPCRHLTIGTLVITVHVAAVSDIIAAIALLNVPVQGIVFQRGPVDANRMSRSAIFTVINAVVCPRLRQEFIQRHANVKRHHPVFVIACRVTIGAWRAVSRGGIRQAVADAVPEIVIPRLQDSIARPEFQ